VPSLSLQFAKNRTLIDTISGQNLITATRPSDATVVNAAGLVETVGSNVARFTHDPVTLESLGLLVEEQRTNLALRSEEFDSASWIKINGSVTANATVAPNGATTADKFVENTANGAHIAANETASVTSGVSYTLSVFVKAAERTWVALFGSGTPFGTTAFYVNLATGAVGSSVGSPSNIVVQRFPDGWFRISCSMTAASTGAAGLQVRPATGDGGQIYQGDGTSGLFAWGAQLEAGSFVTSYIPTAGTTITRAADAVSITGANFSRWYRQDEGVFYGEAFNAISPIGGAARRLFEVNNTTEAERLFCGFNGTTTIQTLMQDDNVIQTNFVQTVAAPVSIAKIAVGYKTNDTASSVNGGAVSSDATCTIPTPTQMTIGMSTSGGNSTINAPIRRIEFWPRRLDNSILQQISAP
jgi:hypothetical protein